MTKAKSGADGARAARMFEALHALEGRERRKVPLEELGQRVADREGRAGKPYAESVVSRWLRGMAEPRTLATWTALADVLGVAPGWLAFGDEAPAHAKGSPVGEPMPMRSIDVGPVGKRRRG